MGESTMKLTKEVLKNLIIDDILDLIDNLPPRDRRDDKVLTQKLKDKVSRGFRKLKRKSPSVEVHLIRIKGRDL